MTLYDGLRKHLVFHDTWQKPVAQAVRELEEKGLVSCERLGLQDWSPDTGAVDASMELSEAKLCRKASNLQLLSFVGRRYMVYKVPLMYSPFRQEGLGASYGMLEPV